jgi:hypothetical protein
MSLEVMKDNVLQKPVHDLESMVYVLLYFCSKYKGPCVTRQGQIDRWFDPQGLYLLALLKADQLKDIRAFTLAFDPYFADLAECVIELWDILFPAELGTRGTVWRDLYHCSATHSALLEVLERKYAELQDFDPDIFSAGALDPV